MTTVRVASVADVDALVVLRQAWTKERLDVGPDPGFGERFRAWFEVERHQRTFWLALAHCSRHGRTVLVPTSRIDGIDNTEHGIVVRWHCSCGELGATRFARRGVPASAHAAPLR